MKTLFPFWQRLGTCLALLMLGACSALHVDVDVYKGPLSNVEDTQLRQYSTLAIAAKPIIAQLRNDFIWNTTLFDGRESGRELYSEWQTKDRNCVNGIMGKANGRFNPVDEFIPCIFQMNETRFLNSILALYENIDDINGRCANPCSATPKNGGSDLNVVARDEKGLEALTQEFIEAENIHSKEKRKTAVNESSRRLGNALVVFAERISFFVNNRDLASTSRKENGGAIGEFFNGTLGGLFSGEKNQSFTRNMAVLQSLANTIIVHADDLRRRDDHLDRLKERKDMELQAAKQSIALSAPQAFTNLLSVVKSRLQNATEDHDIQQKKIEKNDNGKELRGSLADAERIIKRTEKSSEAALATYRTLFDKFSLGNFPDEDAKANADRKALSEILNNAEGEIRFSDMLLQLSEKIDGLDGGKIIAFNPLPADVMRLKLAKKYLLGAKIQNLKIPNGSRKKMSDVLQQKFLADLGTAKKIIDEQKKLADDASTKLNEATALIATSASSEADAAKYTVILQTLEDMRSSVLNKAEKQKISDMSGIRSLLLQDLADKSNQEPKDVRFSKAIAILSKIQPQILLPGNKIAAGAKNQVDVLDDVIAQLRYLQIQAKASGAASEQQESITKALALAYEQRGGFAFLRATSTYLRNAYANTSFQDAGSNSSNMIKPKFGFGHEYSRADREMKMEIDKQYWQNINSIKLSGSGASNYALVKDDIGNWYVKAFESDSEALFKSAQNLALFNLGGKINLNLLQQLDNKRRLDKATGSDRKEILDEMNKVKAGTAANTDGISNVNARFRAKYLERSNEQLTKLNEKLTDLNATIKKAWSGITFASEKSSSDVLDKILMSNTELVAAQKIIIDAFAEVGKKKASPDDVGEILANGTIGALRQIRNMRMRMTSEISSSVLLIEDANTASKKAKEELKNQQIAVARFIKMRDAAQKDVNEVRDGQSSPPTSQQEADLAVAKNKLEGAQKALDAGQEALDKVSADEATAVKALETAILNRKQAAQKFAGVINSLIETTSASRLDAVRAYESAITIIGLTVEGK